MQRLCLTVCGLLASCLCSWAFSVSQSPSEITLKKGGQVQITCSWNRSVTGTKVKWFKDHQKVEINQKDKFREINDSKSSTLVIKNADINDAGFYICEVTQDIPQLVQVNGSGTNVIYEREKSDENVTTEPAISAQVSGATLGASVSGAAVILSICVCLSVWRVKRGCRQSERMVIREGPPSEGEEPENSEDGGSSRGSTQWYMVPVYESYFDLQRCDEQKSAESDNATCATALK